MKKRTSLRLTIDADGECWLHVDVPSGKKAGFNLGKVDHERITGRVLIEAVADLGAGPGTEVVQRGMGGGAEGA
jgi:hypothetical protein